MSEKRADQRLAMEDQLASVFSGGGWSVVRQKMSGSAPDMVIRRGALAYAVEFKYAPEGRRDRVVPLLAQGILEAQALVRRSPELKPLAVIGAPRVSHRLADEVGRFADEHAPGVAVGVLDSEEFREFRGLGLKDLGSERREGPSSSPRSEGRLNLFSDLNQWMLKVLLAPRIDVRLLNAPRESPRGASDLARAAGVSAMSASRLVRGLEEEGFLARSRGDLQLVRVSSLMRRWRAAMRPSRDRPMRWILRGDSREKLREAWASLMDEKNRREPSAHRACLGLFAAAEELGLGFVRGVRPHLLLEAPDRVVEEKLGLMPSQHGESVDIFVRIPREPESVFRGMVFRDGMAVSDVLQVWADVSVHPSRGRAQAEKLERGPLRTIFGVDA